MNNSKKLKQPGNYRTFEISGRTVIVDDFIYRRLFKDPDIPPAKRKYTFIQNIHLCVGYPRIVLRNYKAITLSRYIMHATRGDFVDHINRNPLDNRRCKLRVVNARQNMLNRKIKNNTGLIGVSCGVSDGRTYLSTAFIINKRKGKKLTFSCPDTPFNRILSALARDKFVLQQGEEEYAPLNFPEWQFKPLRNILLKEDLSKYKEKRAKVKTGKQKPKLNPRILRFCRKMARKIKSKIKYKK